LDSVTGLQQLKLLLAEALTCLATAPEPTVIATLANGLAEIHDWAKESGDLVEFRRICQAHPRITEEAVPAAKYRVFRDDPGNVAYIEITK
jgi:hypothetical protein